MTDGMDEHEYLASLRPSRIREVQAGEPAWAEVEVVDVESGEAEAVRAGLEAFGTRVRLTRVGQGRHLTSALGGGTDAEFVVLLCHGDEGSIVLPELAEELQQYQQLHTRVAPDDVRSFARLDGQVVIATGCDTGDPALAEAFLDCGAEAYVAPAGGPFRYASVFAVLFLFYELAGKRSLADAVDRLRAHDDELSMWRLYRRA
jgi:hypothetical protein